MLGKEEEEIKPKETSERKFVRQIGRGRIHRKMGKKDVEERKIRPEEEYL